MRIIEIATLENGGHRNQNESLKRIPGGWAVIPDDMETPNFPFGDVEVKEIKGVMTVTKWTPSDVHKKEFPDFDDIQTTQIQDDTAAMLVDHEYRLTLIELGVIE